MKTEKCHLCNGSIPLHLYELSKAIPKIMEAKQLCFTCAYWQRIKEEDDITRKDNLMEIVPLITPDYHHYIVHTNKVFVDISTFRREYLSSTDKCIAMLTGDNSMVINSYNNWGFQGIIPEHSRGLFTPNGIILTPLEIMEILSRKSFTSEDLKFMIQNYTDNK